MKVVTKKGELPVRFDVNTMALFGDMIDKSMNDVLGLLRDMSKLKFSDALKFYFAAFQEGAIDIGEECQIKDVREMGKMISDDIELISRLSSEYIKQSTPDEDVEEVDDGKKKV